MKDCLDINGFRNVIKNTSQRTKRPTSLIDNIVQFVDELSRMPYHVGEIFDDIDDSYGVVNSLTMQIFDYQAHMGNNIVKVQRAPYMNRKTKIR